MHAAKQLESACRCWVILQAPAEFGLRAVYDSSADVVTRALRTQLSRFVFGAQAEFRRGLQDDPATTRALELLRGVRTPTELLARAAPVH